MLTFEPGCRLGCESANTNRLPVNSAFCHGSARVPARACSQARSATVDSGGGGTCFLTSCWVRQATGTPVCKTPSCARPLHRLHPRESRLRPQQQPNLHYYRRSVSSLRLKSRKQLDPAVTFRRPLCEELSLETPFPNLRPSPPDLTVPNDSTGKMYA